MRRFNFKYKDLRKMYEEHIPVDVISEIFENIDIKEKDYREKALKIMDDKKFDVYGINENVAKNSTSRGLTPVGLDILSNHS